MKHIYLAAIAILAILHPITGHSQGKGPLYPIKDYLNHTPLVVIHPPNPSTDVVQRLNAIQQAIVDQKAAEVAAQQAAQEAARAAQAELDRQVALQTPAPVPAPVIPVQSADYYVNWIIQHESGGDPYAVNPSSGACGLFQRLPCSVSLGDVASQMADGLNYIAARYGTPYNAYLYWQAHGNY